MDQLNMYHKAKPTATTATNAINARYANDSKSQQIRKTYPKYTTLLSIYRVGEGSAFLVGESPI